MCCIIAQCQKNCSFGTKLPVNNVGYNIILLIEIIELYMYHRTVYTAHVQHNNEYDIIILYNDNNIYACTCIQNYFAYRCSSCTHTHTHTHTRTHLHDQITERKKTHTEKRSRVQHSEHRITLSFPRSSFVRHFVI